MGTADMPAMRSRILFAKDGAEKLKSIDSTIEKYGKLSAHRLVDITHRVDSPWSQVKDEPYTRITDELILQFHKAELEI